MHRRTTHMANTDQNGFTLIEIMIAILVLGVGALAIASMQESAIRGNSLGRYYSEAVVMGMDQMEMLLSMPYNDNNLDDGAGENDGEAGLEDGIGAAPVTPDHQVVNGNYTIFWNIAEDQFVEETKTVALYVAFQERGATRTVRMRNVVPRLY